MPGVSDPSGGDTTGEVTAVLQQLIRNECVNDGSAMSGFEARSVEFLADYLGTSGLDVETFEPTPGRSSLVARIEGRDPKQHTLRHSMQQVAGRLAPGATCIPFLTVGATDARFLRRLGIPPYGFGLLSSEPEFLLNLEKLTIS